MLRRAVASNNVSQSCIQHHTHIWTIQEISNLRPPSRNCRRCPGQAATISYLFDYRPYVWDLITEVNLTTTLYY